MKITIRPLEEKDAYTSWRWRNDPEVFANTVRRYSGPVTLQNELDWIRTVLDRPDERRFAILADGIYIGNVYLTEVKNEEATIGIFIGNKKYWNKSAGSETYKQILSYASNILRLSTIKCLIRTENIASRRLNEKFGFFPTRIDDEFVYYIKTMKK